MRGQRCADGFVLQFAIGRALDLTHVDILNGILVGIECETAAYGLKIGGLQGLCIWLGRVQLCQFDRKVQLTEFGVDLVGDGALIQAFKSIQRFAPTDSSERSARRFCSLSLWRTCPLRRIARRNWPGLNGIVRQTRDIGLSDFGGQVSCLVHIVQRRGDIAKLGYQAANAGYFAGANVSRLMETVCDMPCASQRILPGVGSADPLEDRNDYFQ